MRINDGPGHSQFETLKAHGNNHGKFGARPRKEAIGLAEEHSLCVEVAPLHRAAEIGSKAFDGFLVCSTDTSLPVECDPAPMQQAFGLTDAELALVKAIGDGLTNPEIAERRGRAVDTINTQVKSILAKTSCANRTQFVRMMTRFGTNYLRT